MLHHAQIIVYGRDWFEGGFIGVDIFFVISGYLIARIILSELELNGSFSFLNFYERRARRILPMLLTVILASLVCGFYKFLPNEMRELSASSLSSLLFSSNFFFYNIATKYGAESSLLKPMLHTWSLGVEEQFYLIFPILALLVFKYFRSHFLTILFILSLLSLLFSEFNVSRNFDSNFYLPFSRFWELAIGSMLAYIELKRNTSVHNFSKHVLPTLGFCLIICSIFFFDHKTPHPSFYTLIPIIGVALIIIFSSQDELIGKIFSNRIFVWIGLISYSAYLWHFPIFAFARNDVQSLTNIDKLGLMSTTLVLSIASYLLIEKPFRNRLSSKLALLILAFATFITALILTYVGFSDGYEKGWLQYSSDSKVNAYLVIRDSQLPTPVIDRPCIFNVIEEGENNLSNRISACRIHNERAVFIVGDSHGINLFNIFGYSNRYPFIIGVTQGGCRPHGCDKNRPNQYDFFMEKILPLINDKDIIIFHQSGSYLISDNLGINDSQRAFDGGEYTIDFKNIEKVQFFMNLISRNTRAKIYWLGPFLEYRYTPSVIVKMIEKRQNIEQYFYVNSNSVLVFNALELVLKDFSYRAFKYVSFDDFFKVELNAVIVDSSGKKCFQFRDSNHFTECGERLIGKLGNFSFLDF